MNATFGNSRVVAALLVLDSACLWYYTAGGSLGKSLLLLAGLASLGLLPHRYSAGVLDRHKLMLVSAGILFGLAYLLSPSFGESPFAVLVVLVVFALGCGAVSGFLATALARREWVFLAVMALTVALAGWAVTFATVIMPQNMAIMGETVVVSGEIENMFGVFHFGNNYYTLTYFLLVPTAVASLVFGEGITRNSLVLLLAGLASIVLALMFGRRGPVLAGVVTWVVVAICARPPGHSLLRAALVSGLVLVCLGGVVAWLLSQEWGIDVTQGYMDRSALLLEDIRFGLWRDSAECIAEHPFGGGRAFLDGDSQYGHNGLLDAGLDLGVAGLLVYGLLLGQITWRTVARMLRRHQPLGRLEICLFAIILAHLLISMTEPCLPERLIILLWAGVTLSCVSETGAMVSLKRI